MMRVEAVRWRMRDAVRGVDAGGREEASVGVRSGARVVDAARDCNIA